AVAIYVRNLLLNWLVIVPVLCLALLFLRFVAATSVGVARGQDDWWVLIFIGVFGVACLIRAQAFATAHRPPRREPPAPDSSPGDKTGPSPNNIDQRAFLNNDLLWSI